MSTGRPVGGGPAATDEVRRRNTALVLRLLRDGSALSRADLARTTGLAKATVGAIVGDLEELGLVLESPAPRDEPGRGRPGTLVRLDGSRYAGVGVEVNVDYVAVTVLDLTGHELWFERTTWADQPPSTAEVLRLARHHLGRLRATGAVPLGLTVAVPGLIDRSLGLVVDAPNLGWSEESLADRLAQDLADLSPGLHVAVDNDANCAVRAESLQGVAAGETDLVYLTGTVGLGAGIVSGGEVLRGSRGLAGEVGHLRVGSDEPCACGRTGCWEALAGQRGLVAATGLEVAADEDPVAYAARVAALPDAPSLLRPVVAAMVRGVTGLALGLDPAVVVLGGSFVPLADVLVPALEQALESGITGPGTRVVPSTLGLHAASVGAALDALDATYAGRRALPRPAG